MTTYKEKKQTRIIRYKEMAAKMKSQSEALSERAGELAQAFHGGQPILVGHHSEKKARRLQGMIHHKMRKSIQLEEKAKHFEKKAEAIANNSAINSDDPDAKILIIEKLGRLQKEQKDFKEVTKILRTKKRLDNTAKLKFLKQSGYSIKWLGEILELNQDGEYYIPAFRAKNLSANIHATKKRLETLESMEQIPESYEVINDVALHVDKDINRIRLIFPGRPNEAVRDQLKGHGFFWSPINGCWVRKISRHAISQAKGILQGLGQQEGEKG